MTHDTRLLSRTADLANEYLASLATRPVGGPVDLDGLRTALGGPLPVSRRSGPIRTASWATLVLAP